MDDPRKDYTNEFENVLTARGEAGLVKYAAEMCATLKQRLNKAMKCVTDLTEMASVMEAAHQEMVSSMLEKHQNYLQNVLDNVRKNFAKAVAEEK